MTPIEQMATGIYQIKSNAQKVLSDMLFLTSELVKFLLIRKVPAAQAFVYGEQAKTRPFSENDFQGPGFGSSEREGLKQSCEFIAKGWKLHRELSVKAEAMEAEFRALLNNPSNTGHIAPHETHKKI